MARSIHSPEDRHELAPEDAPTIPAPEPVEEDTQEKALTAAQESSAEAGGAAEQEGVETAAEQEETARRQWLRALKRVLPIYIATHLLFLAMTYAVFLWPVKFPVPIASHLKQMAAVWDRFDTVHFLSVASNGYDVWWRTAFFPLYPLLIKGLAFIVRSPLAAALIISNAACLAMFVVLYRLIETDFEEARAWRAVLYYALFPTAFFFAAAYNESLLMVFVLLCFYYMRKGNWWLAGLCGLLASLTRSVGILLILPFCYDYLYQRGFKLRAIRFDVLAGLGIFIGIGLFAVYGYFRFHDPLVFSHAQSYWARHLEPPWVGIQLSLHVLLHNPITSYDSIHNVLDLGVTLLVIAMIVLSVVGPWRLPPRLGSYVLYAAALTFFYLLFPKLTTHSLMSLSRLLLEVFPAFVMLAVFGKREGYRLQYIVVSTALLAFLTLQFLGGHWIA